MLTLTASGDTTGATDTSAINTALGTDDVTLRNTGTWYVKGNASGVAIAMPNSRTLQGEGDSSVNWTRVILAGTASATFESNVISTTPAGSANQITIKKLYIDGGRNGFISTLISFTAATKTISISSGFLHNRGYTTGDTITIAGSASNNGNFTIASITATTVVTNEALTDEGAGASVRIFKSTANGVVGGGSCISLAGQNNYVYTGCLIQDCYIKDAPNQQTSVNSIIGLTMRNVTTTATYYPVAASHGGDFDAVAVDKPSSNIEIIDCDLNAYGQECLKFENTTNVNIRNTTLRAYSTITQDALDMYSQVDNINFINCTFLYWCSIGYTKRKHTAGQAGGVTTPAANLTLGQAAAGTGISCSASANVFSSGDVGKSFAATESSITGFATIRTFANPSTTTIDIISKFADTSVASGWQLGFMDNDGLGRISFTGCTFSGDDALIWGSQNSAANYGTITITNCTFAGRNSYIFPSAFSPTVSGNTGVSSSMVLWVRNTVSDTFKNVFGSTSTGLAAGKSYGNTAAATPVGVIASALYDSYSFANARIIFVDDTYTNTFISGFNTGTANVPFSIESETDYGTTIDGTGSTGAFFGWTNTNTQLVTLRGFIVKNFTGGASTRGFLINNAAAIAQIINCKVQDNACSNGGAGIRIQSASATTRPILRNIWFLNNTISGGTGGGALIDVGADLYSCRFELNTTTGAATGAGCRCGAAQATNFYGCEFVNNTSAGAGGGMTISTAATGGTNIINCTFMSNAGTSAADINMFLNGASVLASVKNTICYSAATPVTKGGTGTETITYSDILGGYAGTGNINTDPLFTDTANRIYTLKFNSPCIGVGSYDATAVDRNGKGYNNPPAMGAWEHYIVGWHRNQISMSLDLV